MSKTNNTSLKEGWCIQYFLESQTELIKKRTLHVQGKVLYFANTLFLARNNAWYVKRFAARKLEEKAAHPGMKLYLKGECFMICIASFKTVWLTCVYQFLNVVCLFELLVVYVYFG